MKVAEVMTRPVYSATPTATAREVAVNLLMSRTSGFPIVDLSGALVGIVTELDLIRALPHGEGPGSDAGRGDHDAGCHHHRRRRGHR